MSDTQEMEWITEQLRGLAVDVGTLHFDPSNARLHNERNLQAIAASLNRFGQRKPVVVQRETRTVIAGNGTLGAARSLGWSHVAAVFVDDDPTTATGYAIADNRTAELATWDEAVLGSLLQSVASGFDAEELGFSSGEIESFLASDQVFDSDFDLQKTPEEKKEAWDGTEIRQVVLLFGADEFKEAVGMLEQASDDLGTDSNSDTVLELLRSHCSARDNA